MKTVSELQLNQMLVLLQEEQNKLDKNSIEYYKLEGAGVLLKAILARL